MEVGMVEVLGIGNWDSGWGFLAVSCGFNLLYIRTVHGFYILPTMV